MTTRRLLSATTAAWLSLAACNLLVGNESGHSDQPGPDDGPGTTSSASGGALDAADNPPDGASSSSTSSASSGGSSGNGSGFCHCGSALMANAGEFCNVCPDANVTLDIGATIDTIAATDTVLFARKIDRTLQRYQLGPDGNVGSPTQIHSNVGGVATAIPPAGPDLVADGSHYVIAGDSTLQLCASDAVEASCPYVTNSETVQSAYRGVVTTLGPELGRVYDGTHAVVHTYDVDDDTIRVAPTVNPSLLFAQGAASAQGGGELLRFTYAGTITPHSSIGLQSVGSLTAIAANEEQLYFAPCVPHPMCSIPTDPTMSDGPTPVGVFEPQTTIRALHVDGSLLIIGTTLKTLWCTLPGCKELVELSGASGSSATLTSFTRNSQRAFALVGGQLHRFYRTTLRP